MSTKREPGKFDCYSKADPDEPMFVLLGRDPIAPFLVGWWVGLKMAIDPDEDEAKLKEALECVHAMDAWLVAMKREDKMKLRELVVEQGLRIASLIEAEDCSYGFSSVAGKLLAEAQKL